MLNAERLPKELREGVWAEAAKYATEIENLIVSANKLIAALRRDEAFR
jgi:hypothetical protein